MIGRLKRHSQVGIHRPAQNQLKTRNKTQHYATSDESERKKEDQFQEWPISSINLNRQEKVQLENSFHHSQYQVSKAYRKGSKTDKQVNYSKTSEMKKSRKGDTSVFGIQGEEENRLENIKVNFKKIEDYEQEQKLKENAKNFVLRIQREKRQTIGRYYLIKKKQEWQKKCLLFEKERLQSQEKENKKAIKKREIEKKLSFFQERASERQYKKRKARILSESKSSSPSKQKQRLEMLKLKEKAEPQPSTRIGNQYLESKGKVKRRSLTQSSEYQTLDPEEREQIQEIRRKIEILQRQLGK